MSNEHLSLEELQQYFVNELTGKEEALFRQHISGNKLNNNVDVLINIYRNNHQSSRLSALSTIFPITKQIIGTENFTPLTLQYIKKVTSKHWDLNTNGEEFIHFIQDKIGNNPNAESLFYLSELSRLEYLFHLSYYADNCPKVTFTNEYSEQLTFNKNPSAYLFTSPYPVYKIWKNNKKGMGEKAVEQNQETYFHLIYRIEYQPIISTLNKTEFALLQSAMTGATLIDLVNKYNEDVAKYIPSFIEKKWLIPAV